MRLLTKYKGYLLTSFYSASKIVSSAGQTYFGLKHVTEYFFTNKNNPAHIIFPTIAIASGLGVNLITRIPAIFKTFASQEKKPRTKPKEDHGPKLDYVGSFFYYSFLLSGFTTNFFNALSSYFGTVVLSEYLAELTQSDTRNELWKEILIQSSAIIVLISSIATYHAYEHQVIKESGKRIAEKMSARDWSFDKNTTKTLFVSSLNLVTTPILTLFWTKPTLAKIPFAKKILGNIGCNSLAWTNATMSIIANIATLPCLYDSFLNETTTFPNTALTKSIRYFTLFSGAIDSLACTFCTFIGITDTAESILGLNPYGPIIAFAAPSGISVGIQNAMFSIRPGYLSLLNTLYKTSESDAEERVPLLMDQDLEANENEDSVMQKIMILK